MKTITFYVNQYGHVTIGRHDEDSFASFATMIHNKRTHQFVWTLARVAGTAERRGVFIVQPTVGYRTASSNGAVQRIREWLN